MRTGTRWLFVRIVFVVTVWVLASEPVFCQTRPIWPEIKISTCPKILPPKSLSQRSWKDTQEQSDFQAGAKAPDQRQAAEFLITFASKYSQSDYRELGLILAMGIGAGLKEVDLQVRAAKALVESPAGEATAFVAGFVTLDASLSPYVFSDDPQRTSKLADLETWTRCGREALAAQARPDNIQSDTFEKSKRTSESVFARTAGFIAFQRQEHGKADRELQKAASLNSDDPLTFLWLSFVKLSGDNPDLNAGLFYLARAAELAPQVSQVTAVLKQSYVTVHGSDKDLGKLRALARSNPAPPPGLSILPKPKKERHYGTAIVATAIVGLLVYGAVAHPDFMMGLGQSVGDSPPNPSASFGQGKIMIFGGSNHDTYLGCLNCASTASDSVSNAHGRNGSKYSQTSIWNRYGEFGSRYSQFSACNPYANEPPVIVDDAGTYYGRLTLNQYHGQLGAGRQLIGWLRLVVCAQ